MTRLWIVGRWLDANEPWAFQGVFDSEARGRDACRDATYFCGPADLNVSLPHEAAEWPGCYFPKGETE